MVSGSILDELIGMINEKIEKINDNEIIRDEIFWNFMMVILFVFYFLLYKKLP